MIEPLIPGTMWPPGTMRFCKYRDACDRKNDKIHRKNFLWDMLFSSILMHLRDLQMYANISIRLLPAV